MRNVRICSVQGMACRAPASRAPLSCACVQKSAVASKAMRLTGNSRAGMARFVVRAEAEEEYEPEMDAMDRMEKSIQSCESDLMGIRTGRAQPAMLANVEVDYYGAPTPLQSLAGVSTPDSQTIMVNPFDKGAMKNIEDAIINSGLGFTPNNDGKVIRINVPPLTEDRRKEMAKLASSTGEDAKVAIRNVRRDVLKKVDKMELSEDDKKATEDEVQKLTDSYIKKVDDIVAKKSKELTTV